MGQYVPFWLEIYLPLWCKMDVCLSLQLRRKLDICLLLWLYDNTLWSWANLWMFVDSNYHGVLFKLLFKDPSFINVQMIYISFRWINPVHNKQISCFPVIHLHLLWSKASKAAHPLWQCNMITSLSTELVFISYQSYSVTLISDHWQFHYPFIYLLIMKIFFFCKQC